ncbi:MAG: acetyltransferase [Endozoicomonas sp. (ex Botrylloides leachii)]|nr:acetyltransferase [Endozoicomonas sp. (ex Botrylloides leachii)]
MSHSIYAIYGAGGFGREVMPLAIDHLNQKGLHHDNLFFIDDAMEGAEVNGFSVLSYKQFIDFSATEKFISFSITNSRIREKLSEKTAADGIKNWSLCHKNVVEMHDVTIGDGAILCPFVTLTSNIKIGKQFHANIYSYIAHDCVIGDYVTFAPGVKCNGNIYIEDHAYIGAGAIIKQGMPGKPLTISKGAIIGMGAIVTKNVPSGETVIGNPAKPLNKSSLRGY